MTQNHTRRLSILLMVFVLVVAAPKTSRGQATPIQHLVVLFQENVSFDHYFGTYPYATNPSGEPAFAALPNTPRANNLLSGGLLTNNPNSTQPFRLDHAQSWTCDQNHNYAPEQKAFDHGLMDQFPQSVGTGGKSNSVECDSTSTGGVWGTGLTMGYYDGNTVTALWNWAQYYAMSDNMYGTMFGPSSPGALQVTTGSTTGVTVCASSSDGTCTGSVGTSGKIAGGAATGVLIGDIDPLYDDCSTATSHGYITPGMNGGNNNIGVLLSNAGTTWAWFQGGFTPTTPYNGTNTASCGHTTTGLPHIGPPSNVPSGCTYYPTNTCTGLTAETDYVSHHNPFDYIQATANPHHLPPTSGIPIGAADPSGANHQYDLSVLSTAIANSTSTCQLPSVSYVKQKAIGNGHPGNSDPLDEQYALVTLVNAIEKSDCWPTTAIVITYDDSDGWYDHQMDPVVNQSSSTPDDFLTDSGKCGTTPGTAPFNNPGRCGYGPRLPFIVISPYAKSNYIDHQIIDQSSVVRFIEDNWLSSERIGGDSNDYKAGTLNGLFNFSEPSAARVILSPTTGEVCERIVCP